MNAKITDPATLDKRFMDGYFVLNDCLFSNIMHSNSSLDPQILKKSMSPLKKPKNLTGERLSDKEIIKKKFPVMNNNIRYFEEKQVISNLPYRYAKEKYKLQTEVKAVQTVSGNIHLQNVLLKTSAAQRNMKENFKNKLYSFAFQMKIKQQFCKTNKNDDANHILNSSHNSKIGFKEQTPGNRKLVIPPKLTPLCLVGFSSKDYQTMQQRSIPAIKDSKSGELQEQKPRNDNQISCKSNQNKDNKIDLLFDWHVEDNHHEQQKDEKKLHPLLKDKPIINQKDHKIQEFI